MTWDMSAHPDETRGEVKSAVPVVVKIKNDVIVHSIPPRPFLVLSSLSQSTYCNYLRSLVTRCRNTCETSTSSAQEIGAWGLRSDEVTSEEFCVRPTVVFPLYCVLRAYVGLVTAVTVTTVYSPRPVESHRLVPWTPLRWDRVDLV